MKSSLRFFIKLKNVLSEISDNLTTEKVHRMTELLNFGFNSYMDMIEILHLVIKAEEDWGLEIVPPRPFKIWFDIWNSAGHNL